MARRRSSSPPTRESHLGRLGNYGYFIGASKIALLGGRWHYAAKVERVVRYDQPTTDVDVPIVGETYGETAGEAISATIAKIDAWIRDRPDFIE